jgi:RimJ/RimL family protein N-acetyltransferase
MHLVPFPADGAPHLASLFMADQPIPIRLWAILDGIIGSRILVDEPSAPTIALVQELAEGTTYVGGAGTPQILTDAIAQLRAYQDVVICAWPNDHLNSILPAAPDYVGMAIDFAERSPAVDLSQLAVPPSGYHLRRIDEEIVPLLEGFDYYVSMFGGVEQALQNTIGYCLMQDATVVSEAVAGPLTRGVAEIGMGTGKVHRRKGFATLTSARVIQECEALGYQAFWNTAQHNEASIALAKRLGFVTERPFNVFAWSAITRAHAAAN